MSSSDIKKLLQSKFPDTKASAWKRRSKRKDGDLVIRVFENDTGKTVEVQEYPDGAFLIVGDTAPIVAPEASKTASKPIVAKVAPAATQAAPAAPEGDLADPATIRAVRTHDAKWSFTEPRPIRHATKDAAYKAIAMSSQWVTTEEIECLNYIYEREGIAPLFMVIPRNTRFTITERKGGNGGWAGSGIPAYFGVKFDDGRTSHIWWADLTGRIALHKDVVESKFVLRDASTGQYFAGRKYDPDHLSMGKTFGSAKKYKTLSAVKAGIRDFTGYTADTEVQGGVHTYQEKAEWLSGSSRGLELPPHFEIVEFDYLKKVEIAVHDCQNWFKELNRLKVITKTHGQAARELFVKLREKDFPFETMIIARKAESYERYNGEDYTVAYELEPEEISEIMLMVNKSDRKSYMTTKSPSSVAVATDDATASMMMLLADTTKYRYEVITNVRTLLDNTLDCL